jgi:Ca2+-binding RTX toxin-like protein
VAGITSISGGSGTHQSVTVFGNGSVSAGNGNDTIAITGSGNITVGSGNDFLSIANGGLISQSGASGHDTINFSSGNDTVYEQGTASVSGVLGLFGSATVSGGELVVGAGTLPLAVTAVSGNVTMTGGLFPNEMIGGTGATTMRGGFSSDTFVGGVGPNSSTYMQGGLGPDTFIGGSGPETMVGGLSRNLFEFLPTAAGGKTVITNFVSGHDQLYLEGNSLSYLVSQGDVVTTGHNTTITLDGGKTTIELQGVTNLKISDVTTHKP